MILVDIDINDFYDAEKAELHTALLSKREAALQKALAAFEKNLEAFPEDERKALRSIFYRKILTILSEVHFVANINSMARELLAVPRDEWPGINARLDVEVQEIREIYEGVR